MRALTASVATGAIVVLAVLSTTAGAAPPGKDCGRMLGPRWTAPGHRSGRYWHVAESGTSCAAAKFAVQRLLQERTDRQGRLKPIAPFLSCAADIRHRNVHPYAAAACVGDRYAVSWGIV